MRYLSLFIIFALVGFGCSGTPLQPPEDLIRADMEALNAYLDSQAYAASVSWDEHIVLTYQHAQHRNPTVLEFVVLRGLLKDPGLRRSDILAIALGNSSETPSWEACAEFNTTKEAKDFKAGKDSRRVAAELNAMPDMAVLDELALTPEERVSAEAEAGLKRHVATPDVPGQEYSTYFGFLHAHSHLSLDADQEGTALEAYTYARDAGGLDFFSLSDHAIFLALWPWQNKFQQIKDAADATYLPGEYATLWGFEWSNPLLGHITVSNTDDFTNTLSTFRLFGFYEWLSKRPDGFARFNHPSDYDYLGIEFYKFFPYHRAIPQMVGLETWNSSEGFDTYHYPGYHGKRSFLDEANLKGWHLGALGAQDNHRRDWGTRNEFRTAVLASDLTREGIIEAYRQRRMYATEDKDLYLDFRCAGYPMGAHIEKVARNFTVTAWDESGDTFQEIRLYRNGEVIATQKVAGNPVEASFSDTAKHRDDDYYYVIVTQNDDNDNNGRNDEALSSPIWIED